MRLSGMTLSGSLLIVCLAVAGCGSPATPTAAPATSTPAGQSPTAPVASSTAQPTSGPGEPQIVTLPPEIMLAAADVGEGYAVTNDEFVDGDWRLEFLTQVCPKYSSTVYSGPAPTHVGGRERVLGKGDDSVIQGVGLSNIDSQRWEMAEVRKFVKDCASFTYQGYKYTLEVPVQSFAGDESLLVKLIYADTANVTTTKHYVYIRHGEVVSQILFDSPHSVEEMKAVAQRAASQMCAMASVC